MSTYSAVFLQKLRFIVVSSIVLSVFHSAIVVAQGSDSQESASSSNEVQVEHDIDADEDEFSIDLKLSEKLKVDETVENLDAKLAMALSDSGINETLLGKLIASGVVLLGTIVAIVLLRMLINVIHRKTITLVESRHINTKTLSFNFRISKIFFTILFGLLSILVFLTVWDFSIFKFISEDSIYWMLQSTVTVFMVIVVGSVIIELASGVVEKTFAKIGGQSNTRMQTLLPIAKNVVFMVLFTLFGLTLLSELGINVMPLLAGAGVVGFAIGFGAQTLVKDLLTGFIIILEDLVQVGDVISVGGKTGLVEKITIRKIQLRNLEGIVSTVPFSEISIVDNYTKTYSYYLLNVGVSYRENTDQVVELLKKVDEDLRSDEEFNKDILGPIEILGVDSFADSAVIIKARIKTQPIQQWRIGREFNRRMKLCFDEQGIEIPFPHQTIYFGEDKDGKSPPAYVNLMSTASNDNAGS